MDPYKEIIITCVADRLLSMRAEKGMTQEEMAELLRITPRAYGDLERKRYCVSAATLLMFLCALEPQDTLALLEDFRTAVMVWERFGVGLGRGGPGLHGQAEPIRSEKNSHRP